jgi:predicted dehydrogenase
MTRADVGFGIVGLGFMGKRYAEFVSRIEGMHLAGVCDLNGALAAEVTKSCGGAVYEDPIALASAPDVDAVMVCTPEHLHVDAAIAGLNASKPVMIEKPIAHSLEAANAIREAASEAGVPVLVGHLLRFEPRWVGAYQRLAAGAIGEILSITTRRIGNILDQEVLQGRTTIPLYYGVHDLDVMHWFANSPATSIYAQKRSGAVRAAGFDADDLYSAILTFGNGVLGTAELGWHVPANAVAGRTSGVTVIGSKGMIRIEQGDTGLESWTDSGLERALDTTFWLEAYGIPGGALGLELRHFADCVRGNAEPAVSLDDAIEALRLSLAMETSAERGSVVDLTSFGTEARG